jgi:AcrR family transcriptional regulator
MATKTAKRASAREGLLAAADVLFYRDGVHSTGIDAVIEKAGAAKGSLYYIFGGKDELVAAYLRGRHEAFRQRVEERGDAFNIEGDEISFDCMTELVFADRDDLLAWMTSLGVDEIVRDEENFIDRATTRAYVVDERTTAG